MTQALRIDIISDVVCPWCVIGILALERAVAAAGDVLSADIRLHPFELNPDMPEGGQDVGEHIREKYGVRADDGGAARARMKAMAAELGFDMAMRPGARIYNTFHAHRLIDWAAGQGPGRTLAVKHALFAAYFTDGHDPSDRDVLRAAAVTAGLDAAAARAVIEGDARTIDVRRAEAHWRGEGVSSIPTIIVNDRYVIQGAQAATTYERALRRIAAEAVVTV